MAIRDQQKVRLSAVAGTFYEGDSLLLRRRLAEAEGKLPPPDPRAPRRPGRGPAACRLPLFAADRDGGHGASAEAGRSAGSSCSALRIISGSAESPCRPSTAGGRRSATCRPPVELIGTMGEWNSPLVAVRDDAPYQGAFARGAAAAGAVHLRQPEVLPLVVGSLSMQDVHSLAPLMASLDAPGTLWIVSSDFTHYGAGFRYVPFTENVLERLREQDHTAAELIANRDLPGFAAFLGRTGATICGMNPIALFLGILDVLDPAHEIKGRITAESNSGELTGDCSNAVGYESICFTH